jgi:ribose transport system ATP-binding protein
MECPLIELRKVSKFFPGVIALNKADLKLYSGEVHGLMGENGAGKSTLIKLLTGAYKPDEGEMLLDGQPLKVNGPKDAMNMGLTAIYQELNVIPKLTVWENIFLGRELRNKKGLLDIPQMKERAKELLQQLRQNIDVDEKVENLGMGHQQMVEICKALVLESRLIIMDEPTSSLSAGETEELLRTARELRDRGMAIVFISHHMDEIFRICDRLTVLRDGCVIQSMLAKDTNTENLIKLMVGRDINQQFPKIVAAKKEELLRIEDFTSEDGSFKDISFSVCGGEVLGFAGLVGAGRTEVMRAIFGADARKTGKVYVKGKEADIRSPKAAISYGIAFLTEDRKGEGLVLSNTVGFNINLSTFEKSKRGLLLNNALLRNKAKNDITQLRIKTPSINTTVRGLSGGNQQKVVIAKWLETNADIFIMDEPTRGLDVGAKLEVYNIVNNLVSEGKAVIMVSSELPEVMGMSDRIIVMHEGYMAGEFKRDEVEREAIMMAASGGEQNDRYSNDNG